VVVVVANKSLPNQDVESSITSPLSSVATEDDDSLLLYIM